MRPVDCTERRVAPVLDTVSAAGSLGLSAVSLFFNAAFGGDREAFIGVGVIAAIGLSFATSAWSGYSKTARCREMNRTPPPPSAALPPPSSMPPPGMSTDAGTYHFELAGGVPAQWSLTRTTHTARCGRSELGLHALLRAIMARPECD